MISEFLLVLDHTDPSKQLAVVTAKELIGSVTNMKTSGKMVKKTYNVTSDEKSRVYTYNFKKKQIELDEIVAIEVISGNAEYFQTASYKTSPIRSTKMDKVAVVDKGMRYKLKFENPFKIANNKTLALLQIENYIEKAALEDIVVYVSDDISFYLDYDMGMIIGSWCCCGGIRQEQDSHSVFWKLKNANYAQNIYDIILANFPDSDISIRKNKWGDTYINLFNNDLAVWLDKAHLDPFSRGIPEVYYSADTEFVDGFLFGAMLVNGRYTYNKNKKILYYTISSVSSAFIAQLGEIMNLHRNIPSVISSFVIPNTETELHVLNIRVTDEALESLPIEFFVEDIDSDFIPKSIKSYLKNDEHLLVVNNSNVAAVSDTSESYVIHLKNNSNIIGLNGLIHKAQKSIN